MRRRALGSGALLAGLALVLLVAAAGPAGAHAQLVASSPRAGQVLDAAPRAVTLTFTETVEAALGAIRVFDGRGERVDAGRIEQPSPETVATPLGELTGGSYVVTWRVLSADSHPVSGSFTFQIGEGAEPVDPSLVERLFAAQGGDDVVGIVFAIARFVAFAGLALLLGAVAFFVIVWPGGWRWRRAHVIVWVGWGAAMVGTLAGLLLQGPNAAGLGIADALDLSLARDVLDTRYGAVQVARIGLLLLAVPLLQLLRRRRGGAPARAGAAVVGVALAATPGLAGHASVGTAVPFALFADTVHVAAVSLWLGGLVALLGVLLPSSDDDVRTFVPRASQYFLFTVAFVVLSGAFASWRAVRSLDNVLDTDYGRLLLVKLGIFAFLVVVAALGRDLVNRAWRGHSRDDDAALDDSGDDRRDARALRRIVAIEVVAGIAALAVTAILVNTVPAKDAAVADVNFVERIETADGAHLVDVIVDPADVGRNDVHATILNRAGAPVDVIDMSVELSLPGRGIAAIDVPVQRLSPGHYLAVAVDLPIAGDWRLEVKAKLDQFTETTAVATVPIR